MVRTRSAVAAATEYISHPQGNDSSRGNPAALRATAKPRNRLWPFGRNNNEPPTSAAAPASGNSQLPELQATSSYQGAADTIRQQPSQNGWPPESHDDSRGHGGAGSNISLVHKAEPGNFTAQPPDDAGGNQQTLHEAEDAAYLSAHTSGDGTQSYWTPRQSSASGGLPVSRGAALSPEYRDALSANPSDDGGAISDSHSSMSAEDADCAQYGDAADDRPATAPSPASHNGFPANPFQESEQQGGRGHGVNGRSSPVGRLPPARQSQSPSKQQQPQRPQTAPSRPDPTSMVDGAMTISQPWNSRTQALQRLKQRTAARRSMVGGALPPAAALLQPTAKPLPAVPLPGAAQGRPPVPRQPAASRQQAAPGRSPSKPAQGQAPAVQESPASPQHAPIRPNRQPVPKKRVSSALRKTSDELLKAVFEGAYVRRLLHVTLSGLCRRILDLQAFVDGLRKQQLEANAASPALLRQAETNCSTARTRFQEILRGDTLPDMSDRLQHVDFQYTGDEAPASQSQQARALPPPQRGASRTGSDMAISATPALEGSSSDSLELASGDSGTPPSPLPATGPPRQSANGIERQLPQLPSPQKRRPEAAAPAAPAAVTPGRASRQARRSANLRRLSSVGFGQPAPPPPPPPPPPPDSPQAMDIPPAHPQTMHSTAQEETRSNNAACGTDGKAFLKRRSQRTVVSQKLDWSAVKSRTNSRLDINLTLPKKTPIRRNTTAAATSRTSRVSLGGAVRQRPATGGAGGIGIPVTPLRGNRTSGSSHVNSGSKRRGSMRGVQVVPSSPAYKARRRDWGSGAHLPDIGLTRPPPRRSSLAGAKQGPRSRYTQQQQQTAPRARTAAAIAHERSRTSSRAQAALDHLTASGGGDDGPLADLLEQVGELLSDLNATQRELDSPY